MCVMERKDPEDGGKYKVEVIGDINKTLYFDKPEVKTYEIAAKLQIDKDSIFVIDGKTIPPGTIIQIDKEFIVKYEKVNTDS